MRSARKHRQGRDESGFFFPLTSVGRMISALP